MKNHTSTTSIRLSYTWTLCLHPNDTLIVKKRGGGERRIPPSKWWINRNTPVGEDAELLERKPYNGYHCIPWNNLIAVERSATSDQQPKA